MLFISDERRSRKPYAIPVQYVTYNSIKDSEIRTLAEKLKAEMVRIGMQVVGKLTTMSCQSVLAMCAITQLGLVTDGEFNSLRTHGKDRPTSVLKIRSDVTNRVGRYKLQQLKDMLTPSSKTDTKHYTIKSQQLSQLFRCLPKWPGHSQSRQCRH